MKSPLDLANRSPSWNANTGPRCWRRDDLAQEEWRIALPERCWAELDEVAQRVRLEEPPVTSLRADRFDLSRCGEVMATGRRQLIDGVGFAVLDRVPVERYGLPENQAIAWLLAQLLGQVVAQKCDGTRLYDVHDSGKPLTHDVRRSVTTLEQQLHTDGGWLTSPPHFVGYINNPQVAHSRTAFRDDGFRRHLLRLWNRDEDSRGLAG